MFPRVILPFSEKGWDGRLASAIVRLSEIAAIAIQVCFSISTTSKNKCVMSPHQWSSLLTAVTPEATELVSPPPPPPPPPPSGSVEHARQGNFLYSATRYLGWLIP